MARKRRKNSSPFWQYRGYACQMTSGASYACPGLKLYGYATPTQLERAINRKLVVGGTRKPYPKGRNPKLAPFAGVRSGQYPRWDVDGRMFGDVVTARTFARQRVLNTGEDETIMQQDDNVSPWFMLERWTPSSVRPAYDLTKSNPRGKYQKRGRRSYGRNPETITSRKAGSMLRAAGVKRLPKVGICTSLGDGREICHDSRGYYVVGHTKEQWGKLESDMFERSRRGRNPGIKVGDKVAYSATWLRSTGQVAGDAAHARGVVKKLANLSKGASPLVLAHVKWDRDMPEKVNVRNLAVVGKYGFSAMNPGGFSDIRPGDTVEFLNYAGMGRGGPEYKPKRGRVVMRGDYGWVLNAGGAHGTPAIVDTKNFLRIVKKG